MFLFQTQPHCLLPRILDQLVIPLLNSKKPTPLPMVQCTKMYLHQVSIKICCWEERGSRELTPSPWCSTVTKLYLYQVSIKYAVQGRGVRLRTNRIVQQVKRTQTRLSVAVTDRNTCETWPKVYAGFPRSLKSWKVSELAKMYSRTLKILKWVKSFSFIVWKLKKNLFWAFFNATDGPIN